MSRTFTLEGEVFEFHEGRYRVRLIVHMPDGREEILQSYTDHDTVIAARLVMEIIIDVVLKSLKDVLEADGIQVVRCLPIKAMNLNA